MKYFQIFVFAHGKSNFKVVVKVQGDDSCRTLGELLLKAAHFPEDIVYSFLVMDDNGNTIKEIFADDSFIEEDSESFAVVDQYSVAELAYLVKGYTCLFVYNAISGDAFNLMLSEYEEEETFISRIIQIEGDAPILLNDGLDPLPFDSFDLKETAFEDVEEEDDEEV